MTITKLTVADRLRRIFIMRLRSHSWWIGRKAPCSSVRRNAPGKAILGAYDLVTRMA